MRGRNFRVGKAPKTPQFPFGALPVPQGEKVTPTSPCSAGAAGAGAELCSVPAGSEVSQESLLLHGPFARKPKRIRTAFSPSQLLRLERAFEKNHYVVGAERKQLASSLSLSETQVPPPARPTPVPRCPAVSRDPQPREQLGAGRSEQRQARTALLLRNPSWDCPGAPARADPAGVSGLLGVGLGFFCVAAFGCYSRRGRFGAGNAALASSRAPERFSGVVSRLLGVFSLGAVYGFKNPVRKGAAA